jgi:hypothetical protein
MTDLLHIKLNVPKSRYQHQCTLQLVCEDRMLFVRVYLRVSFAGSNSYEANEQFVSHIQLSFTKFAFIEPHKQKSNGV